MTEVGHIHGAAKSHDIPAPEQRGLQGRPAMACDRTHARVLAAAKKTGCNATQLVRCSGVMLRLSRRLVAHTASVCTVIFEDRLEDELADFSDRFSCKVWLKRYFRERWRCGFRRAGRLNVSKHRRENKELENIPLGTTHTPPLDIANSFVSASFAVPPFSSAGGPTVTNTLPWCTKNTICILREFFARLKPSGGSSTIPEPKKGSVIILAYWKADPATSRVTIDDDAYAMSVNGQCVT
jgi:hypothetical protein